MRTPTSRYTEWLDLHSDTVIARELYDHREDPGETTNLAPRAEFSGRVAELQQKLARGEGWRDERRRLSRGGRRLTLGRPFTDHMVLQRDKPLRVWGEARAGARVLVRFGDASSETNADRNGTWSVELPPMIASSNPRALTVSTGEESLKIEDVLVGDVWLCAGQSNMRFALSQSSRSKDAIAAADDSGLRLFDMSGRIYPSRRKYTLELLRDVTAENYYTTDGWRRASSTTAAGFSAVAYHFGAFLRRELKVPIGLIHNAVGGVPMESYIPREALQADPQLKSLVDRWYDNEHYPQWCRERGRFNLSAWLQSPQLPAPHHPFEPGFLFAAGMRPFTQFPLRGFVWYQGESNATEDGATGAPVSSAVNRRKHEALIKSWRDAWNDPKLPFYLVQLPGMSPSWMRFREMQLEIARSVPGVGVAVTIDVGHRTNVHPPDKKPVGERLARAALAGTYGHEVIAGGPLHRSHEIVASEIRLTFDHVGAGLRTSDGRPPRGFEIAGDDRVFHQAQASLRGETVVASSPEVSRPVAVRYGWAPFPDVNLVNTDGLPASPFRTDDWDDPALSERTASAGITTSFEMAVPGEFLNLETDGLKWTAAAGHSEVDAKHARSGKRCLRLLGGPDRTVELALPAESRLSAVSFWAERWTRRQPFRFRISAFSEGSWEQIYNGDAELVIGKFKTRVSLPLPQAATKLRFTSTSPSGSGVLIDDFSIELKREDD